tara:strand:- start:215 stop:997 length:783 start_codon:yes stop_codon:yes gene_type:complete
MILSNLNRYFCVFFLLLYTSLGRTSLAENTSTSHDNDFSFEGPLGVFDKNSLQRGLQIYVEICSSCHSLEHVTYRSLSSLGYSNEQITQFASQFEVMDGPNQEGDMFARQAKPSDKFIKPFPNNQAAKAANNGALPPDLSLIVKARHGGASYIKAFLLGYKEAPEGFDVGTGYYNTQIHGNVVAMPPIFYGDDVTYLDGTEATLENQANDIVAFLTWTSMPEMEKRKSIGLKVLIFLIIMTSLFYSSYYKIWKKVKDNSI